MSKKKERHLHNAIIPFEYNKKNLSLSTDVRIYRDCALLSIGEWTDSISRTPIEYTEKALEQGATNWEENYLNVDHSFETRNRLGFVTNPYYKNGKVYGDLNIFPITTVAKDIIALIDAGLVNWISVELTSEDEWTDEKILANNICFLGAAVVLYPACSDGTYIKEDGPQAYGSR